MKTKKVDKSPRSFYFLSFKRESQRKKLEGSRIVRKVGNCVFGSSMNAGYYSNSNIDKQGNTGITG